MQAPRHRAATSVVALLLLAACQRASPSQQPGSTSGTTREVAASSAESSAESSADTTGPMLEGKVQLIDIAAFEQTPAEEDPYPDRPADATTCEFGFGLENGLFELQTDLCGYAAFGQPTLAPVRVGDRLEFLLIHDALYAEEPNVSAHLSMALGDTVIWETSIPLPAEPGIVRPEWTSSVDAPEGTTLRLHLHNHGVNNYRLAAMTVQYDG